MGAPSYREDIIERYDESTPDSESCQIYVQSFAAPPELRVMYCPICPEGFLEDDLLERHVAVAHGVQHVYLKVNGRIVRDICWPNSTLTECTLVVLKVPELLVSFDVQGRVGQCVLHKTSSLKSYLTPIPREGRIRIRTAEPFPREFTIYLEKQPAFESQALDETLIVLMDQIRQGAEVDLVGFRERNAPPRLGELEARYLQGVLEYCHAWQLETKGGHRLAKERLEAAMNLLTPFKTSLADELRNVLSLKMNCFAGQWACDALSPFRAAEQFFCLRAPPRDNGPVIDPRELRVPIDSVSRRILDALRAYYKNDYVTVLGILLELQRGSYVLGKNDEVKLTLVEARTRERGGDIGAAAGLYETLVDHPIFGNEARRCQEFTAAS